MADVENNLDRLIQLYRIYSDDLKKFDTICWQYPLALVTVNFLAAYHLRTNPIALAALTIVNFLFIGPLVKNVYLRQAIVTSMRNIEGRLRADLGQNFVVDFNLSDPTFSWLRWRTLFLLTWGLLFLNFIFFLVAALLIFLT